METFDQLFHHEHFVRQILQGLLRDPTAIDDAVQETWLRAWRRPPQGVVEPRTWLARVARNLAVSRWRSDQRRAARERAVVSGEVESPEATQRRVEVRQQVVAAILALDEPYRGVVLLRYEQGLDVRAIAERLGRSAATVRSQLSRAHDQLRARLDREFGGRQQWSVLAATLVGEKTAAPAVGFGLLAASAGAIALAAGWLAWPSFDPAPPAPVAPARTAVVAAAAAPTFEQPAAEARERVEAAPQDPARGPALRQPAELFDRSYYDDYELATFSFEHGVRDDPDLSITRNKWHLVFAAGEFDTMNPRSVIVDLGPIEPASFASADLPTIVPARRAKVRAGHAYFVGTNDQETTLATVVFVREHEPGRTCRFDWFTTDGTGRWQGSLADPGKGKAWVDVLVELYGTMRTAQNVRVLARPSVCWQLRGGAGGGNPRRIDLAGVSNVYVDKRSEQPIDVVTPPTTQERCQAWSDGGTVPVGSVFAITRIDYAGGARGDSNGHGEFRIVVNDQDVVKFDASTTPIAGTWTGRLMVANGAEGDTYFEIANSSWGEVRVSGEFVAGAGRPGFGGLNAGFGRVPPRVVMPVQVLGVPEARLQVRTASVGGNACRIDLRGRRGFRTDRLANEPLDFSAPLAAGETCVAFAKAGNLTPNTVFVVTSVRYTGGTGDASGTAFRIVVAGKAIAESKVANDTLQGEWRGLLEVVPGEEMRTFVEVGNGSHADVLFSGRFELR